MRILSTLMIAVALGSVSAFAQDALDTRRILYCAYWHVDASYSSKLEAHNNSISKTLIITPILYSTDGRSQRLAATELAPLGNATIDLGDGLRAAGGRLGQYGAAAIEYQSDVDGALSAEISVVDSKRSVLFTVPSKARTRGTELSSVFWSPLDDSELYVALQNTSATPAVVTPILQTKQGQQRLGPVIVAPNGSALLTAEKLGVGEGGVVLQVSGQPGAVNATGWLEEERRGFSTMITFDDVPGQGSPGVLFGTQLFVGSVNGIPIDSQVVLRNNSAAAVSARMEITVETDGRSLPAPPLRLELRAGEVAAVDLDRLLNGLTREKAAVATARVVHNGLAGALTARYYGISKDRKLGFYSRFESYTAGVFSELYWSLQNEDTTLMTVANFGDSTEEVTVALTHNGGQFVLPPLRLQAGQSTTIDVRALAENGTRDMSGKVFPSQVSKGGWRIAADPFNGKLQVRTQVLNKKLKMAAPFYGMPVYASYLALEPGGFSMFIGGVDYVHPRIHWSDYSVTEDYGAWVSSTNPSVAYIGGGNSVQAATGGLVYLNATSSWLLICSYGCYGNLNAAPVYVSVKTPFRMYPLNTQVQGGAQCPAGQAGWSRRITAQLQDSSGSPYARAGINMADMITIGAPNGLGINGHQTGAFPTDASGNWPDTYFVCSAVCINPANASTSALQNWTYNGLPLPHVNAVVYRCGGITVDGR